MTTDTPPRRVVVAMMTARAWIALVAALREMGGPTRQETRRCP